jgi:hypothetical protein
VYKLSLPSRVKPTTVIPSWSASFTASSAGAERETITGMPILATFINISVNVMFINPTDLILFYSL